MNTTLHPWNESTLWMDSQKGWTGSYYGEFSPNYFEYRLCFAQELAPSYSQLIGIGELCMILSCYFDKDSIVPVSFITWGCNFPYRSSKGLDFLLPKKYRSDTARCRCSSYIFWRGVSVWWLSVWCIAVSQYEVLNFPIRTPPGSFENKFEQHP